MPTIGGLEFFLKTMKLARSCFWLANWIKFLFFYLILIYGAVINKLKNAKTNLQPEHAYDWRLGVNFYFFLDTHEWHSMYFTIKVTHWQKPLNNVRLCLRLAVWSFFNFFLDTYMWHSMLLVKKCGNYLFAVKQ